MKRPKRLISGVSEQGRMKVGTWAINGAIENVDSARIEIP